MKYSLSENQNTKVAINISLLNKTGIYYVSSYKISLGFDNIQNVRASDSKGNILKNIEKKDGQQVLSVTFNDKITGINNKLNFTVSFDTPDVAKNLGRIWEVNIPGLSSQADITNFNVDVSVPSNFGQASFIKPSLSNPRFSNNTYSFSREDLNNSGISMTFGNKQVYKLKLAYHIENKNLFPIKTEIAFPPNTNYQTVQIDNISEKPTNVKIDGDGNWLAEYSIPPSQKKDIVLDTKIAVELAPRKQPESKENLNKYLKNDKYWEITNKKIADKAKELKTPHDVYKFVADTLKYDYSRVDLEKPRLGALQTLENPSSAVCLEFTDLFIALARSAGIPAREVDGYAYTQNSKDRPVSLVKDILHAWPEYYDFDKETWIMIDPTWANTTGGMDFFSVLDFDHITFVIKGEDSTYPVPAGGYKITGKENIKDVEVGFANSFENTNPVIKASTNLPDKLLAGLTSSGEILIENTGKVASPPQKVTLKTDFLKPMKKTFYTSAIPPYGSQIIQINFAQTHFLTNKSDTVKIILGESVFIHKVKITPIFLNEWAIIGGITFLAGLCITISIIAIKPWNLSIFRRKGESSLRG